MPFRSTPRNPDIVILRLYVPGSTAEKVNAPLDSVVIGRVLPVASFRSSTVAPGRNNPCWSRTMPVMTPVLVVCAKASPDVASTATRAAHHILSIRNFTSLLLGQQTPQEPRGNEFDNVYINTRAVNYQAEGPSASLASFFAAPRLRPVTVRLRPHSTARQPSHRTTRWSPDRRRESAANADGPQRSPGRRRSRRERCGADR